MVVGQVAVTAYVREGEVLTATDVGLESFDYLQLGVTEGTGGSAGVPRTAVYSVSAQQFYILENNATTLTSGKDYSVWFKAMGNSLRAPQFL